MPFVEITDFSPGIQSKQSLTTPPGAAVPEHTFGCVSEGMALVPGPRLSDRVAIATSVFTSVADEDLDSYEGFFPVGVRAVGPVFSSETVGRDIDLNRTEVVVGFEWWENVSETLSQGWSDVKRWQRDKATRIWKGMHPYPKDNGVDLYGPHPGEMTIEFARNNPATPTTIGPVVVCTLPYRGVPYMWPDPEDPGGLETVGVDCVQTMSSNATGGDFTLTLWGEETDPINYNATTGAVETELETLSMIASGDISVSGTGPNYVFTFDGTGYDKTDVPRIVLDSTGLTGGSTHNLVMTTQGVPIAAAGEGKTGYIIDSGNSLHVDGDGTAGNFQYPPENFVAHQGRMVLFPKILYAAGDETGRVWSNQAGMYFTPVNDFTEAEDTTGFLETPFDTDDPYGFATYASMTANQLFILMRKGGAVKVMGPLNDSNVVNLPNVKSPGFAISQGAKTPLGFAYGVENGGVWVWEGGDTSTPISQNMVDDFWRPVNPTAGHVYDVGPTTFASWGEWIVAPNNYLFDIVSLGWWRLWPDEDAAIDYVDEPFAATPLELENFGRGFCHADSDHNDRWCYFIPRHITSTDNSVIYEFDKRVRASGYSWQSHPLLLSDPYRKVEVKGVAMTLSGTGTVNVTVKGATTVDGNYSTATFAVDSTFPTKFYQPIKVHDTHAQILITSKSDDFEFDLDTYDPAEGETGTDPAPTVYSVALDVQESTHKVQLGDSVTWGV